MAILLYKTVSDFSIGFCVEKSIEKQYNKKSPAIKQIDENGNFTEVAETDADGYAIFNNLPNGTYQAYEVSTISGYILDSTTQNFVIANGQTPSLKFLNSKKPSINITKQDSLTGELLTDVATFRIEQIDSAVYCFAKL